MVREAKPMDIAESNAGVSRRRAAWNGKGALVLVAAAFTLLSVASALTKRPWSDEGHLASASHNLATNGSMGTLMLPEENSVGFQGISRHTYWIMPLTMVSQAGWYKLFGFSLFSQRAMSIAYGLLAVFCCYWFLHRLSGDRSVALLAALIMATDYNVVNQASMGRPDMMCAALGLAAWACYLALRERRLALALLCSHTLVTLSGLCHPNGVLYFVGLVALIVWRDRGRLTLGRLGTCALPYAAGIVGYGLYVLQAPGDFVAQFWDNARAGTRADGFRAPLTALWREATERYARGFGLLGHEPGHSGPIYLKALILAGFAAGLVMALSVPSLRRRPGVRQVLLLFGLVSFVLALLDGLKYTLYLVHTLPLLAMLFAFSLIWLWERDAPRRWAAGVALAGLLALQVGGTVLRCWQNTYQKRYLPAARFLVASCSDAPLIVGSIQFYFDLRDARRLLDDPYLGYFTHKEAGCIVADDIYDRSFEEIAKANPSASAHIRQVLARYRLVYDHAGIRVFRRP